MPATLQPCMAWDTSSLCLGSAASNIRHLRPPPLPPLQGWQRFTSGSFACTPIDGNHLWIQDKAAKQAWLASIAKDLEGVMGSRA